MMVVGEIFVLVFVFERDGLPALHEILDVADATGLRRSHRFQYGLVSHNVFSERASLNDISSTRFTGESVSTHALAPQASLVPE